MVMSSHPELEVVYRIGNAPVLTFPYPHIYVRDVFPADYYAELLRRLPAPEFYKSLAEARGTKGYPERSVLELAPENVAALPEADRGFWAELAAWMQGENFGRLIMDKFGPYLADRFQNAPNADVFSEALLVEDRSRYALGPHTDSPLKVISMLFYLPLDASQAHMGTSIYVPRDSGFSCEGGPHYSHDRFDRMTTMPFLPNAMFAFVKTSRSFHGVERILEENVRRHLLLYDIRLRAPLPPAVPNFTAPSGMRFGV